MDGERTRAGALGPDVDKPRSPTRTRREAHDQRSWEPNRVYLKGDVVTDDVVPAGMSPDEYPTPRGRFRALADHYAGILGPRFLEIDAPGVWERIETFETPDM